MLNQQNDMKNDTNNNLIIDNIKSMIFKCYVYN